MPYCPCCGRNLKENDELSPLEQAVLELSSKLQDIERHVKILHEKILPVYG